MSSGVLEKIGFRLMYSSQTNLNRLKILYRTSVCDTLPSKLPYEWLDTLINLRELGVGKLPVSLSVDTNDWSMDDFRNSSYITFSNPPPPPNKHGQHTARVDINSQAIVNEILTGELFQLISEYYHGNDFWVRNNPVLVHDSQKDRATDCNEGLFHLDWVERQVSLIVLLCDLDEYHTHTEVIPGTSRKSWLFMGDDRENKRFIARAGKLRKKKGVLKTVGKAGDMFLIDAGNSMHRACYGKDRKMMHFNFAQFRRYARFSKQKYQGHELVDKISPESMATLKANRWGDAFDKII